MAYQRTENEGDTFPWCCQIQPIDGVRTKNGKELKKEGYGSMDSKISDEGDISMRWLDNGAVTLASSFVGIDEKDKVRHWSVSAKDHG